MTHRGWPCLHVHILDFSLVVFVFFRCLFTKRVADQEIVSCEICRYVLVYKFRSAVTKRFTSCNYVGILRFYRDRFKEVEMQYRAR